MAVLADGLLQTSSAATMAGPHRARAGARHGARLSRHLRATANIATLQHAACNMAPAPRQTPHRRYAPERVLTDCGYELWHSATEQNSERTDGSHRVWTAPADRQALTANTRGCA
jgi:hypothetical protein